MAIRVYISKHCKPCHNIERLIKESGFKNGDDKIELIDIESDDGFLKFQEEVLSRGNGAVPSAYKNGKQCLVGLDEEKKLAFDCHVDNPQDES